MRPGRITFAVRHHLPVGARPLFPAFTQPGGTSHQASQHEFKLIAL